jgi:hypothetical protein
MALLLNPLADLPPLVGALTWFYLKVGMTLATLYWLFRLVPQAGVPFPPWGKALVVLLSLRPIMGDLTHGNVNLFILFLVMAAIYAWHKGRDITGGLLLALSIACKVTPALFVPYLVWKRAWRALAGCAAGLVLFFWLVPGTFLGWDQNAQLLASWTDQMVKPFVVGGVVTSTHNNQSLPGLVYRMTTHSPSFLYYEGEHKDQPTRQEYHNLLDLDPAIAGGIVKACMLAFAGLVVWSCRMPVGQRRGWQLPAEFAMVVLGMLLFSERTWKHHCVTLVLPFAVLCYYLTACQPRGWLRGYLIGTLVATAGLMATTSTSLFDFLGDNAAKMAQVYGAYVWAYLVLLAALVVLLRRGAPLQHEAESAAEPVEVPASSGALEVVHQRVSCYLDPAAERARQSLATKRDEKGTHLIIKLLNM